MGQLNCPVSGICGYLRAPHKFAGICGPPQFVGYLRAPTVCGLFAGPHSLPAICGPPQFCGLLWAPVVCGHPQFVGLKLCQFCGLIIDGRRVLIQKIV